MHLQMSTTYSNQLENLNCKDISPSISKNHNYIIINVGKNTEFLNSNKNIMIWINRGILQSPIINGNTCYQKHIPHRERAFIWYLAPLAFLSHLNLGERMRNSETLVEVKTPRHRPSKRLRINHKIMEYFYSTAPILLPYQQCSSTFMGDYSWSSARRTLS